MTGAVLTQLSIANFKRFRRLELPLRPLTALTGLNGGGKTTVIQALLLARQASRGASPSEAVRLNGPYGLLLGDTSDVLHDDAEDGEGIRVRVVDADVEYTWEFAGAGDRALNLAVRARPEAPPHAFGGPERALLYLCAERWGPRDVQGMSSANLADLHPGHQGEHVAQVLALLDSEPVREPLLHPRALEGEARIETLRQNVEWWLSSIVCPVTLSANTVPQTSVAVLRYGIPGRPLTHVRPPNGAFGVTYALPVIVAALLAPRGGLLLVENPEAHLHPAGQSAMGRFLARLASDGVQVIVETHSDHVINGMRRAIGAEGSPPADDVVIHFFSAAPDGSALVARAGRCCSRRSARRRRWWCARRGRGAPCGHRRWRPTCRGSPPASTGCTAFAAPTPTGNRSRTRLEGRTLKTCRARRRGRFGSCRRGVAVRSRSMVRANSTCASCFRRRAEKMRCASPAVSPRGSRCVRTVATPWAFAMPRSTGAPSPPQCVTFCAACARSARGVAPRRTPSPCPRAHRSASSERFEAPRTSRTTETPTPTGAPAGSCHRASPRDASRRAP